MYDYYLGGHHNTPTDRALAEQMIAFSPRIVPSARSNRAFLRRVVQFLAAQGIDQFLDLGSGIPTVGNVHEVLMRINLRAHVVYVDIDPVAVSWSRRILAGNQRVAAIQADARDIAGLLHHPDVQRLLDFSRPVAVLMIALLHFIPDDAQAFGITRTLHDVLAPGSYIALSHGTHDEAARDRLAVPGPLEQRMAQATQVYDRAANQLRLRSPAQIAALLEGFTPVAPGLAYVPDWRPDAAEDVLFTQSEHSGMLGAVAQKHYGRE